MARRREPKQPLKLAKLRAARARAVTRRAELELEAERFVEESMAAEEALVRQMVRELYDGGDSIAEIQRAYGTKDYQTIRDIINSTASEATIDMNSEIYSYDPKTRVLTVNYAQYGPLELSGTATIGVWDDRQGGIMLLPFDGVTSDALNDPIAKLLTPLAAENEYRREALEFLESRGVSFDSEQTLDIGFDYRDNEESESVGDLRDLFREDPDWQEED